MTPQEITQAVRSGSAQQGWAVYRYNMLLGVFKLVCRLALAGIFTAGAYFMVQGWQQGQPGIEVPLVFMVLVAVLFLWYLISFLPEILHASSSIMVLTDKEAVLDVRGKVSAYPYSQIKNMRIVMVTGRNVFPYSYIEFVDGATSQLIRFVEGRTFGNVNSIHTMLRSKMS